MGWIVVRILSFYMIHDMDSLGLLYYGTMPVQDGFKMRAERGLSTLNPRHRFLFSGTYASSYAPDNPGLRFLLGGWQIGSIVTAQSGLPFTVNVTSDPANTGQLFQRPNLTGNPNQRGQRNAQQWFNTSVF